MDDLSGVERRTGFVPWILLAAAGVVIFLVGVTIGAVSRHDAAVQVTATSTVTAFAAPPAAITTAPAPGALPTQFGDGEYQVGVDIAPGDYHTDGGPGCYWERLSNLSGGFTGIITNGEPAGPTTVRVESSDKAFGVHGDCTWTLVP